MKMLEDYIQDIRRLFFISVDKNPEKWKEIGNDIYEFQYGSWSSDKIFIDLSKSTLYMGSSKDDSDKVVISEYKNLFVLDREVYDYVKKLKVHFKAAAENALNRQKIKRLDEGFSELIKMYHNEYDKKLRKDKLENLDNK